MSARYFNALERLWPQSNGDATVLRRVLQQYDALRLIEAPPLSTPVLLPGAVVVATVEAMRGHEFDIVIIPDAKAGAFPRYYVPDAFVFSPTRGFIPRDNVGAQGAGRTAKFTWYLHAVGARASYNREERRLFAFAISRARKNVVIAAAGPPTRGIAAPEFLEEIRRAGLHGVEDLRRSAQSNPRTENIF
jgi:superfamily I DNA/RNA helicase